MNERDTFRVVMMTIVSVSLIIVTLSAGMTALSFRQRPPPAEFGNIIAAGLGSLLTVLGALIRGAYQLRSDSRALSDLPDIAQQMQPPIAAVQAPLQQMAAPAAPAIVEVTNMNVESQTVGTQTHIGEKPDA